MLRKIKLYGELAEFVGHKEFEVQVDSLQKAKKEMEWIPQTNFSELVKKMVDNDLELLKNA